MNLALLLLLFTHAALCAESEPIYLPTDYVESTPLNSFDSSKTFSWPSQTANQQILEVQGSSLYEALNKYPGIQTQGEISAGPPSIKIRGSGSTTRNLILLDGTPLQTQDGLGSNPLLIPEETLSAVDIIKGPASLFYGSSAVGGAINLRTRTYDRPTIRLGIESFEKYSSLFGIPLFKTETSNLQGTAYLSDSKGNYAYDDPSEGRRTRQFNNRSKQRYTLSGSNKFSKVKLSHQFLYATEKGQSPGPIPFNSTALTEFDRNAYLGAMSAEMSLNQSFLNFRLSHLATNANTFESGSNSKYKTQKTFASMHYGYDFSTDLSAQIFTDYIYDRFQNTPSLSKTLTEDRFEHGFLVQYQLSEQESLLAGLRYFPDENETVKNILLKQDHGPFNIYGSYSEGLQLPSFNQKYNDSFGAVPNPNLKTEQSNQIEFGIEKPKNRQGFQFLDPFTLKASLFLIEYTDFIQFVSSGTPYSYLNSGDVDSRGAEFSADYNFAIFNIYAAYSYVDTEIKNDQLPVIGAPKHQAYLLTGAMMGPLVFELHNTFWSKTRSQNNEYEKAWIVTDFTVRTVELNNWLVKAGLLNIFNKDRVFTRFGNNYYPEPGRQFFVFVERYF